MRIALQAPKMVISALHTRTERATNVHEPENCQSTVTPCASFNPDRAVPPGSASADQSFDIGSFHLVRKFVEHVVARNASGILAGSHSSPYAIDWVNVEASVADSRSLEQAIGRAVVIADQMSRGLSDDTGPGDALSLRQGEDPFFAFSMDDVVPDFGDESRYRTNVTRRVVRIFGPRRKAVARSD